MDEVGELQLACCFHQGFALTPSANPGICRGFFSSLGAEKMAASACRFYAATAPRQPCRSNWWLVFGRAPARLFLGPPSSSSGLADNC